MKSELENSLDELILKFVNGAKDGIDLLTGEFPEFVNQIVVYHINKCIFDITLTLIIAVSSSLILLKIFKANKDNADMVAACSIGWGTVAVVTIIILSNVVPDLIKLRTAPSLFIVEYVSKLL